MKGSKIYRYKLNKNSEFQQEIARLPFLFEGLNRLVISLVVGCLMKFFILTVAFDSTERVPCYPRSSSFESRSESLILDFR